MDRRARSQSKVTIPQGRLRRQDGDRDYGPQMNADERRS